jgi:hypothetical protein
MLFSKKQINIILFSALCLFMIACVYLGYTSININEGFVITDPIITNIPTTTMPMPTGIPTTTMPMPTGIPTTTMPMPTGIPTTTMPMPTGIPTTTMPMPTGIPTTTMPMPTGIPTTTMLMPTGIPTTTMANRPTTTSALTRTTMPKLMDNGFKIPQTNLIQTDFNGTSNVYSPYLYMNGTKENFQPSTYDMNKYQTF